MRSPLEAVAGADRLTASAHPESLAEKPVDGRQPAATASAFTPRHNGARWQYPGKFPWRKPYGNRQIAALHGLLQIKG